MTISAERLMALSRLLDEALALSEQERNTWLKQTAERYPELFPTLQSMLSQQGDTASDALLATLPKLTVTSLKVSTSEFSPGTSVGPYQLIRELGKGGMGEVWLADRHDGALTRHVALKLPHAHLLAGNLRRRFDRERDILAKLSHPHIATLYDAGISSSGYPYLSMEWIDGVPITQYCKEKCLSIDGRLQLIKQVLDAIQYAHTRFIAHRDLKPSNILVTQTGQVKLLDFGVAKLLSNDDDSVAETELTQIGGRAVTPTYAAPEQLTGQPLTTAVDLYALGIILFELLTGTLPFARRSALDERSLPLASRHIADGHANTVANHTTKQLRSQLRGDLDAIIVKALAFDATHRYRSAEAFANDVERYQHHKPISARHVGPFTLLYKFIQRHRLTTVLSVALILAITLGVMGVISRTIEARRAADNAEREAQRATMEAAREKAVKNFLTDILKATDPRIGSGKPRSAITAKELLDASTDKIAHQFDDDPDTRIELLGTIAEMYHEFKDWPRYKAIHEQHAQLVKKRYGELHPRFIDSLLDDADFANDESQSAETAALLDQSRRLILKANLQNSVVYAKWLLVRSRFLQDNVQSYSERVDALKNSIAIYEKIAPDERNYTAALNELGLAYTEKEKFADAIAVYKKAVVIREKYHGPFDAELGTIYDNLGLDYWYLGDYEQAEKTLAHAVELIKNTVGPQDYGAWETIAPYAKVVHQRGDWLHGRAILEEVLQQASRRSKQSKAVREINATRYVEEVYAGCLVADGQPERAIPLLKQAERFYSQAQGSEYDVRRVRLTLGDAYDLIGRDDLARNVLKSALDDYAAKEAADGIIVLKARERWARFLLRTHHFEEAEAQFRQVLAMDHKRNLAPTALAYGGLAQLAMQRNDAEQAQQFSANAVDMIEHVTGLRDVRMAPYLWRIHAQVLLFSGDATEAQRWAQHAVDADVKYNHPQSRETADAQNILLRVTAALKQ